MRISDWSSDVCSSDLPAPWVKTSLGPGSLVVTDYLKKANVLDDLQKLGFFVVGYGCTTCIGNSGPLPAAVSKAIADGELVVSSVLSGNRNFEGRVHSEVKRSEEHTSELQSLMRISY